MAARRMRQSAEETKRQLIEAGVDALRSSGMSVGLDSVNLEDAVRDADVPRSSAYAVWSGDGEMSPQETFQRAVLYHVVQERQRTLQWLSQQTETIFGELEGTMGRKEMLREAIRRISAGNAEAGNESIEWRLAIALRAVLNSIPDESRENDLNIWLRESALTLRQFTIDNIYRPLAAGFELEPRPQYGERAFELSEAAVASLSEGLSIRSLIDSYERLEGLAHPDHAEQNWTLFGLMTEKVVHTFFEPRSGTWDEY